MSLNALKLITAVTLLGLALPALAGQKRFVLHGAGAERVTSGIERRGGKTLRPMKYKEAVIVEAEQADVEETAQMLGLRYEEDSIARILGGPSASGSKKAPVNEGPQTITWGQSAIKSRLANTVSTGAGITVCVVDTGVDDSHPDLAANIIGGENFVMMKGKVKSRLWRDDNGHGTHVSGTIAAVDNAFGVVGVAPQAKIFAVKALGSDGLGFSSDVVDGILSCVDHGAHIINLSLSIPIDLESFHDAIKVATSAGISVVAAAGNRGGPVEYPAAYPEVVAVSAIDMAIMFPYFSNFGPEIDVTAPGVSIFSTVLGGGYAAYSGTSMAAPHVSGVIALQKSAGKAVYRTRAIMSLTAEQQGAGLIDADLTVRGESSNPFPY